MIMGGCREGSRSMVMGCGCEGSGAMLVRFALSRVEPCLSLIRNLSDTDHDLRGQDGFDSSNKLIASCIEE
jgi:hypothetical protein